MVERVAGLGLRIEMGTEVDAEELAVSLRELRSVKLEIDGDVPEVTGITRADQHALIQAWTDRHADR